MYFRYVERISQKLSKHELSVINLDFIKSVISQDLLEFMTFLLGFQRIAYIKASRPRASESELVIK